MLPRLCELRSSREALSRCASTNILRLRPQCRLQRPSTFVARRRFGVKTADTSSALGREFRFSAEDARRSFEGWATRNLSFSHSIEGVRSVYLPFWMFVADASRSPSGPRPSALLQIFAGDSLPRVYSNVLKADSRHECLPFRSSFLDALGATKIDVEPFRLYEQTAWTAAKEAYAAKHFPSHDPKAVEWRGETIRSYRVFQPAHIVTYRLLIGSFHVVVSGATGEVFGIPHILVNPGVAQFSSDAGEFLLEFARRITKSPQAAQGIATILLAVGRPLLKFLLWPPFAAAATVVVGGFFVARGTAGLRESRRHEAQWVQTRTRESIEQGGLSDTWRYKPTEEGTSGAAGGERQSAGQQAWQQRAEQQRAEQQRAEQQRAEQQQKRSEQQPRSEQERQQSTQQTKTIPPVPPDDYYGLLGLKDGPASPLAEIQGGFRQQLMRYHPDHARDYDFAAASERTRLILRAYGELRDPKKKLVYDATSPFVRKRAWSGAAATFR